MITAQAPSLEFNATLWRGLTACSAVLVALLIAILRFGPDAQSPLSSSLVALERQAHRLFAPAANNEVSALSQKPRAKIVILGEEALLSGSYDPADEATGRLAGRTDFDGASIRFANGDTLKTRPDRLAQSQEARSDGQTWASAFQIPAGVQLEIREIVKSQAPGLCAGSEIETLAIVQTQKELLLLPVSAPSTKPPCPLLRLKKAE